MIPLIPALALAFVSFLASAFVILRIIIPILPPSPLSRRVSPAEFGLPTFGSLSPAHKGHLWLAGFDLLALCIFIWHVVSEATSGPSGAAIAQDPLSSVRLWFIMTTRQGCLLMLATLTLLHVRMGKAFSFGKKHWMLWAPVILLACTSTALAGVLSAANVSSLFPGLTAYSTLFALLTSIAFAYLFITLFMIKKNLNALNEEQDSWPEVKQLDKSRPSFGTEDVDAVKDGASWITSSAGSRRNSASTWSFSTHHTAVASSHHGHSYSRGPSGHHGSVPPKSAFWFASVNNDDVIPPVPPLPSLYGPSTDDLGDTDPFRRELPPLPDYPRGRLGSQNSWMTSSNGSHTTVTAWSFPPSHGEYEASVHSPSVQDYQTAVSRPTTPALATANVLGGYGFAPNASTEKGLASLAAPGSVEIEISPRPIIGWFISIWLPFALALPYCIILSLQATVSTPVYVLYVLSVTLSGPLLALNVIFGSALPIPTGLFDARETPVTQPKRISTAPSELPPYKWSHEYKRSMSTTPTVVEGRRSGDVWITKGDAVDGKSKLSRAISMLSPNPKLFVLPQDEDDDMPITPPLPIQEGDSSLPVNIHNTPRSECSAQFGRLRTRVESKASSNYANEEQEFASRIMVAQRHYSTLAQTVVVPAGNSPEKLQYDEDPVIGNATGVVAKKHIGSHLRTRSVSSISGPQTPTGSSFNDISPPPPFPLPPTPPNVRAARLAQMSHKKSFSSNYSFGPVDDINEIDALTAGVLPILVPGLKVGQGMRIKDGDYSPPGTFSKSKGRKMGKQLKEFGQDFSSPEIHSTPANGGRRPRERKISHKKNHFSLPSLGKTSNWTTEIKTTMETRVSQYIAVPSQVDVGYRNTVFGDDVVPNVLANSNPPVQEEPRRQGANLGRAHSTRSLGLRADVPRNIESNRSSMASIREVPPSAASTVTLFEDFEAGLQHPQSHSTPHSTITNKPIRQPAPPMPKVNRRSSIVYIKSDENTNTTTSPESATSAMASFGQWSARAVRPLIPKTGSFKRKNNVKPKGGSPSEGLRQLTLLQERDPNLATGSGSSPVAITSDYYNTNYVVEEPVKALSLGKRQKQRLSMAPLDENAVPDILLPRANKNLKSLTLARSDTSKMRGILRRSEVLPDVVVRPPSTSDHTAFAYSFRED
ncbi:hypothetical protein FA15DRAFT_703262 [Coprinopsis marcescibilis]|uniref:Uncharacterized protein n=1 Tax=Coprinopsis marcescibilis TaxID=230819 RepID=A0A5C3L059_COPMA|nr:hypothetical protein FA15DRAFT_703262 [Coprinopsis marcescibilis]